MSKVRSLWNQPLRLASTAFVLAGAVTIVGACSSGEVAGRGAAADEDSVALAKQGLGWLGGCACLPIATCAGAGSTCVRAPTAGDCPLINKCLLGSSWCYVVPDNNVCIIGGGTIGLKDACDGGHCGTCPGCYLANGLCQPGNALAACGLLGDKCQNCNDGNACTTDSCTSRGTCSNIAVADTTPCTGGACFGGTCCAGCMLNGACQSGVSLEACGAAGAACTACAAPANRCRRATCIAGVCGDEPVPVGTSCTDGNVCNGEEICDGNGTCTPGTPKDCTSSDPACITASCDSTQGCLITPNPGATCNDGNLCTVGERCDADGKCAGGSARNCSDGKACTDDSCDPATGSCQNVAVANGTACDDGATCTTGETCQNGVCTASGAVACDDKNSCTRDTLDCNVTPPTCTSDSVPMNGQACFPTDKCFYVGMCNGGTCAGTVPVVCDDGNPCTKDGCDPATGCTHANEPLTTACVDGNPCTTDDRCRVTGKCAGTPIVCAALDDCHLPGACDATTGRCGTDPRRNDGAPCANDTGSCVSGTCQITAAGGAAGAAGAPGIAGGLAAAGTANSGTGAAGLAGIAGASPSSGGSTGTTTASGGDATVGGTTSGGTTSSSKAGSSVDEGDVYQRNPGGCGCSVPSRSSHRGLALLGLIGVALGLRRRRR